MALTEAVGRELLNTSGSSYQALIDLVPGSGSSDPRNFVPVNGGYAFVAYDESGTAVLWFGDNL